MKDRHTVTTGYEWHACSIPSTGVWEDQRRTDQHVGAQTKYITRRTFAKHTTETVVRGDRYFWFVRKW